MDHKRLSRLAQLALLSAILLIMAFTPLGYLNIGPLSITFLCVPVVIGAMTMGVRGGCILGAFFGATSFVQCFGISPFGVALLAIDPLLTAVVCFVPRILVGFIAAIVFRGFKRRGAAFPAAALAGSLTNTILFLGGVVLFFGSSEYIQSFGANVMEIVVALGLVNALVEAVVCTIVGGLLGKACVSFLEKRR